MPEIRFRIRVTPSRWQGRLLLLLVLLLAVILSFSVWHDQKGPLVLIATTAGLVLQETLKPEPDDTLWLSEAGKGVWLADHQTVDIGRKSLATPFVLVLWLTDSERTQGRWQLIWRDQLDSAGWCRLRRIILNRRCQAK